MNNLALVQIEVLVQYRQRGIIWNNGGMIYWRIYGTLSLDGLTKIVSMNMMYTILLYGDIN